MTVPPPVLVGLDLGTSSCKAIAFTPAGDRLAEARGTYGTHGTGAERLQHADEWVAAAFACLRDLARDLAGRPVAALGLSGQIGTHVLVDAAGRPIGDAVTWQDGRAGPYADRVAGIVPDDWLAAELRHRLPPSAAWPLPRLAWFAAEYPADVARARYLLSPKDYLVSALIGETVSDPACWRGLARPDGTVVTEALARLGLPDLLPPLRRPEEAAGGLTEAVAARTGLPAGLPVVTGLNDLNAALIGIGAVEDGMVFDIGGTSEHLGFIGPTPADDWRVASVPLHAVDLGLYSMYGVTSNAGSLVTWVGQTWAVGDEPEALAAQSVPGAAGLICVPYLLGERAPIWDAQATGGYVGLTANHTPADFVRAALEAVACNLRAIRDTLPEPWPTGAIRSTGGTTRSALWNAIKAAVLGQPFQLLAEPEAAGLGAAILAGVGAGVFGSVREGCTAMVRPGPLVEPVEGLVTTYDGVYAMYTRAAAAVRDLGKPPPRRLSKQA